MKYRELCLPVLTQVHVSFNWCYACRGSLLDEDAVMTHVLETERREVSQLACITLYFRVFACAGYFAIKHRSQCLWLGLRRD